MKGLKACCSPSAHWWIEGIIGWDGGRGLLVGRWAGGQRTSPDQPRRPTMLQSQDAAPSQDPPPTQQPTYSSLFSQQPCNLFFMWLSKERTIDRKRPKKMRMTMPGEDGKLASAATAAFVPQHHQQPRKLTLSKDYTFLLCLSRPQPLSPSLNHDLVAGPVPVQRQSMERCLPKLASSPLPPVLLHPVPNLPSQPLQRWGDQQQQLLLHRTHGRRSACWPVRTSPSHPRLSQKRFWRVECWGKVWGLWPVWDAPRVPNAPWQVQLPSTFASPTQSPPPKNCLDGQSHANPTLLAPYGDDPVQAQGAQVDERRNEKVPEGARRPGGGRAQRQGGAKVLRQREEVLLPSPLYILVWRWLAEQERGVDEVGGVGAGQPVVCLHRHRQLRPRHAAARPQRQALLCRKDPLHQWQW